jgi:hypothetical protein
MGSKLYTDNAMEHRTAHESVMRTKQQHGLLVNRGQIVGQHMLGNTNKGYSIQLSKTRSRVQYQSIQLLPA